MKYFPQEIKNSSIKIERQIVSFFLVLGLIASILLLSWETAHAGFLNIFSNILGSEQASAFATPVAPSTPNSQKIALLQAAVNRDPNPEKSADVVPVNSEALVPDLAQDNTGATQGGQVSTYIVRPGDSLSGIAQMYGVSVNTIMWANNMTKASLIKPGQTLVILPVTGISYTVKKGDTIKGIVNKYKADLDEVLLYNDLSLSTAIVVGQTIIIPDVELPSLTPSSSATAKTNGAHHTNGPTYDGYYAKPVPGAVKSQGLHGYNGVDFAAPSGTPIYASAAGKVIVSIGNGGWNGGYGNYIIISHSNGTQTLYSHNSKNLVSVGEVVEKGQKIGLVGNTGKSTGPHVHFEIRGAKQPF